VSDQPNWHLGPMVNTLHARGRNANYIWSLSDFRILAIDDADAVGVRVTRARARRSWLKSPRTKFDLEGLQSLASTGSASRQSLPRSSEKMVLQIAPPALP
jgi:hypothetical protein